MHPTDAALILPQDQPRGNHNQSAPIAVTGRAVLAAWLISIMVHVSLLALMFVIVFPYNPAETRETAPALVSIVGEIDANPGALSGALDAPPLPHSGETEVPSDVPPEWTGAHALSELNAAGAPGTAGAGEGSGTGSGAGGLSIVGIGAGGGDFSRYGLTVGGGGAGPQFFGLGGSARGVRSIVYVVDRSGSMLDTFGHVRAELRRSIGALRRSQKFHVIFFSSGEPLENPPGKPVSAIEAQKESFFAFLNGIMPEGSTHPERAMRRALAVEPDLIYFLTDGEFDRGLIPKLDEWNRSRRVKIYTIAYFDAAGAALLEEIAREHHGEYKFVSEYDLP